MGVCFWWIWEGEGGGRKMGVAWGRGPVRLLIGLEKGGFLSMERVPSPSFLPINRLSIMNIDFTLL